MSYGYDCFSRPFKGIEFQIVSGDGRHPSPLYVHDDIEDAFVRLIKEKRAIWRSMGKEARKPYGNYRNFVRSMDGVYRVLVPGRLVRSEGDTVVLEMAWDCEDKLYLTDYRMEAWN